MLEKKDYPKPAYTADNLIILIPDELKDYNLCKLAVEQAGSILIDLDEETRESIKNDFHITDEQYNILNDQFENGDINIQDFNEENPIFSNPLFNRIFFKEFLALADNCLYCNVPNTVFTLVLLSLEMLIFSPIIL